MEGVGDRLKRLRKLRGLTQRQLAGRAHLSLSLIKKVEQGSVPPSAALVTATARALSVTPATLYSAEPPDMADRPEVEATSIGHLRAALDSYDDPRPEGEPMTLDAAARDVAHAGEDIMRLRYREAAAALPGLLHHLFVLAEAPGQQGERARALLHDAYRMVVSVTGQLRQPELAAVASERHIQLAPTTGDPRRIAISAYGRSTRHLQHGDYSLGLRILDRAHEYAGSDPAGRAVAVQLHLRGAVMAARGGNQAEGDARIQAARALLDGSVPDRPYYNIDASPLNVDIHWCACPVETYDGTEAARRGEATHVEDPRRPERVGHHHLDMARAWLLHGDRDRSLYHLNAARQIAPHRTRNHPSTLATVRTLAEQDRRVTGSLASFARWAGITI
jgi:transcriptional regulator with XRE-family HTH domain